MTTNYDTTELSEALETAIDNVGAVQLLESIAEVLYAKSDHIRVNWQDRDLAKQWEKRALQIDKLAHTWTTNPI